MAYQTQRRIGRRVAGDSANRIATPCPVCSQPMGAEIALLVGQHITCAPLDQAAARKAAAVEALLALVGNPAAPAAFRVRRPSC